MPAFVVPQLCRLLDAPPTGAGWVHETKFDGYRLQLRVEKHRAVLKTRKALDWSTRFAEIAREARRLPDCMIDGEIWALDTTGRSNFALLQQALSEKKTDALVYYVFDLLFENGKDLRGQPLSARKERLAKLIEGRKDVPHFRYVAHSTADGRNLLRAACRSGQEGIVSKRLDAPYRSGRHDFWTKEKCRGGQEVVIGGWWGGPTQLRSLVIGAFQGKNFAYLGRVGTGFNAENSGPLLAALKKITRKTSPFTAGAKPPRTRDIAWVDPKLVAEVDYATITTDGLLRQASFKGLREDKPARAVVLEIPAPVARTEKMSAHETKLRGKRRAQGGDPIAGVAISNPEKVLWPAAGEGGAVTKRDLARFYELAAPRMLPRIVGRPLSLVRAPDGIGGEIFYQRHLLAGVTGGRGIAIAGEKRLFHAIDDVEGLVGLAQAAVLEIHPWGCKENAPESPEILIFDLDPGPGLDFNDVVMAACDLADRLRALALTPFAKITGGKGMHVVTAIAGTTKNPPSWDDARAFARAFAEAAARASPARYVATMGKQHRGGKIFIDYLRNARMTTAVAPYSPRARPGATIAMPLAWNDVKKGLDPKSFTVASAAKWLKRADPWKDFARSAGSLETARKKLERVA